MHSSDTPMNRSLQWMIAAGVDANDVAWLESMEGATVLLHRSDNRRRVVRIYQLAMKGLLATPSPELQIIKLLN